MSASITYPVDGRGAWPSSGKGGTLRADGTLPGRYYRAAVGAAVPIGRVGYRADRDSAACSIDEYAVWRGAVAIQTELKELGFLSTSVDGLWGTLTDEAVKRYQLSKALSPDGVFGPASARKLFEPLAVKYCTQIDSAHANLLTRVVVGTINWESGWDPGAVGSDVNDLGLGQINGPANPTLSTDQRLSPRSALPWVARFCDGNLAYFSYDLDAGIAAYNLGRGGASSWVRAGKPDIWTVNGTPRDVRRYINEILSATA